MEEKKIVFVCTGNTCRSPMAEAILRSELRRLNIGGVTVLSAGTRASESETMNPKSAAVLSENGLSIDNFNSRRLDGELLKSAFAIICMTDALRDLLMDMRWNVLRKEGYAEIENNVYSFSDLAGYEIPDPFGKELDCYRLTYRKLSEGMPRVIERLLLSFSVPEGELLPEVAPAGRLLRLRKRRFCRRGRMRAPRGRGPVHPPAERANRARNPENGGAGGREQPRPDPEPARPEPKRPPRQRPQRKNPETIRENRAERQRAGRRRSREKPAAGLRKSPRKGPRKNRPEKTTAGKCGSCFPADKMIY